MKRAAIFDLDGTVADTLESIAYSANLALRPFGFGPFSLAQYKYFVGEGAANLIRKCLAAGGGAEYKWFEKAYGEYRRVFREHCVYKVKPYDGVRELLETLKEKGIKIAVFSNKPHEMTLKVVETLFGRDYFDMILGQTEGLPLKPDPAGMFRIMERFSLKPEDVVYAGDTFTDMQEGKNAGAFTVGVLWGFRDRRELEENGADAIIGHPEELLNYI